MPSRIPTGTFGWFSVVGLSFGILITGSDRELTDSLHHFTTPRHAKTEMHSREVLHSAPSAV
jgi:hypothetical protein